MQEHTTTHAVYTSATLSAPSNFYPVLPHIKLSNQNNPTLSHTNTRGSILCHSLWIQPRNNILSSHNATPNAKADQCCILGKLKKGSSLCNFNVLRCINWTGRQSHQFWFPPDGSTGSLLYVKHVKGLRIKWRKGRLQQSAESWLFKI